jgi:hypothetical protein
MNIPKMARIVFSSSFALVCGLSASDARAYTRQVCAQAGIVKLAATQAIDWYNTYCQMEVLLNDITPGASRELDFPLQLDSASATVYGQAAVNGSGWGLGGEEQVEAQLITVYQGGGYYTASTASPTTSTIGANTLTFNASLPSSGSAFIAVFAQQMATIYSVTWTQ